MALLFWYEYLQLRHKYQSFKIFVTSLFHKRQILYRGLPFCNSVRNKIYVMKIRVLEPAGKVPEI